MIVKCSINNAFEINKELLSTIDKSYLPKNGVFQDLIINKEYLVYGIRVINGLPWYFILSDEDLYYPYLYPSAMFDTIHHNMPTCWKVGFQQQNDGTVITEIFFEEWINNNMFFEHLLDGNQVEREIFAKYIKLIDEEMMWVVDLIKAEKLGDRWLLCPECGESWLEKKNSSAVFCPNGICKTILENPYFIENKN